MAYQTNKVGDWAFIIGAVLAILAGFIPNIPEILLILAILGLVVGFLNVTDKETTAFLVASIALLTVGAAGSVLISEIGAVPIISTYIATILGNIVAFVAPATVVVALKDVYAIASKA